MPKFGPMLAAQKYQQPQDLWTPKHEALVLKHLATDGFLIVQPKYDGMRVLIDEGRPMSRSWTPWTHIPMQRWARDHSDLLQGWDGEVIPGHAYDPTIFRSAMSGIRSAGGSETFTFYLFDNWDPSWAGKRYIDRYEAARHDFEQHGIFREGDGYHAQVVLVPSYKVESLEGIYAHEVDFLAQGFEGAIIRRPFSGYKYGRSTAVGGELVKIKRFKDFEAVIVGYNEAEQNTNELTTSALGYAKRSAHQAGKVGKGYLGSFECHRLGDPSNTFAIGVFKGWTIEDRRRLWEARERLPGLIIKCKEQEASGGYDKARTPVFDGFRDEIDL